MEDNFPGKEMSIYPDIFNLHIDLDRQKALEQMDRIGLVKGYLYGLKLANLHNPNENQYLVYDRQVYKAGQDIGKIVRKFDPFIDATVPVPTLKLSEAIAMFEKQEKADIELVRQYRSKESYGLLPESRKTEAVTDAAISVNPDTILYIPEGLQTAERYLAAIKQKGSLILEIAQDKLTPELCKAIKNLYPYFFINHPDKLPDSLGKVEGLEKFSTTWETGELLGILPPDKIDSEMAAWFVKEDPALISWLPKNVQTEELAFTAAQQSGSMAFLGDFDEKIMTDRVINEVRMTDLALTLRTNDKPTAEKCIEIDKEFPQFWDKHADLLPQEVKEGCNVYRLNKMIEKITSEKFSINQIKDLLDGGTLPVGKVSLPNKVLYNLLVTFESKSQHLKASPMPEQGMNMKNRQKPDEKKQEKPETHHKKRGPKI